MEARGVPVERAQQPATAVGKPVGSNPTYEERSKSLTRALSRSTSGRVAPEEGGESGKANVKEGVSVAFLDDVMCRVLPQFGLTRDALSTPTKREAWMKRLVPSTKDDVALDVANDSPVVTAENGELLVDLGDGLQVRKADVEHVRRLVRLPRCRNNKWELVEAEVDVNALPAEIDADTPLRVRIKGDPNAKWKDFLAVRDVALVQTSDIVDFVVKPITQWRDGKLLVEKVETKLDDEGEELVVKSDRKTFVEHVADVHPKGRRWVERNYVGTADIFVSHAWMDSYLDFSDAMTGGSSMGSKHYQANLAREILSFVPLERILHKIFRTWKEKSAAQWKRWIAAFVTSLVLFPFRQIGTFFTMFTGIAFLVGLLPVGWLNSIATFMRGRGLTGRNRYWVDIFCKNQWVVNSDGTEAELEEGVGGVGALWLVTHSWHTPHALTRAWCQFELRAARLTGKGIVGKACKVEEDKLHSKCRAVLRKGWFWMSLLNPCAANVIPASEVIAGFEMLKDTLSKVDAREANARFQRDKDHILDLIRQGVPEGDDGSVSSIQGEAAIDAHNEDLKESYLDMISGMMASYTGARAESGLTASFGYAGLLVFVLSVFIAESEREFAISFVGVGIGAVCVGLMVFVTQLVNIQMQLSFAEPLRSEAWKKKKRAMSETHRKRQLGILGVYLGLFAIGLCSLFLATLSNSLRDKCSAHPLARDPNIPSCTFSPTSSAPRALRDYKHSEIGTYYQMPNKTVNGKPVYEAYNDDDTGRDIDEDFGFRTGVTALACYKRYLYYDDSNDWIVGDREDMEIGRASGYIFSATAYADSPAWLPPDERWQLSYNGKRHYGALKLTCRNQPAAPPPPAASTPACTFALHADAPIDVHDATHVLGTYYLMSNKTVNGKPVYQLNGDRYLYYDDANDWIVGDREDMEIGRARGYILSSTAYADSPAWLPPDERWKLSYNGQSHYGALKLTCRNQPAAPPPPAASTPACTFALHADAPIDVHDATHVLGTYYLMSNKTVNGKPVYQLNGDRYLYYDDANDWIVGRRENMEIGRASGYIFSATAYADSPAWLPPDERWRLWHNGKRHYGALKLTCQNQPAAPPPPAASTPACTFALHADAPIDVHDATHVLGTYYLMSNKTVNGKPVYQLNGDRYLYYIDENYWIVGRRENMEIGRASGYIFSSGTAYADSPAWLPPDERWRLFYNGQSHYGVLKLTCRNHAAAPPPPPPP